MTAVDSMTPPMPPPAAATAPSAAPSAAPAPAQSATEPVGDMFAHVLDVLDRDALACCVTHAYHAFPQHVEHDVDCVVPRDALPRRLGELLARNEQLIGGRIVQWFEERANFVVLQGYQTRGGDDGDDGDDGDANAADAAAARGAPVMLQLHVSSDFEVNNRVVARGSDILATRRAFRDRFWIPAAHVEFACVLANRIDKGHLDPAHTRQLSALWAVDPLRCSEQLERMFGPPSVALIGASALRDEWGPVVKALPALRREMMRRLAARQPLGFLARLLDKQVRRAKRWAAPRGGLHVVFLGPDGVGKSTVIEAVQERLAPAFLRTAYQTFARGILGRRGKASPHALPPRSLPGSLLKAAWWLACYTLGYYKSVYPTIVRGGLVINHRYLLDAIVDPRRYRYAGPMSLLRAIWRVAPKPDLVIVLDAPADIIHARKRETTLDETRRQRAAYLALAATLPNARVVDTSRSPRETIEEVTNILLDHMAAGVARRLKLT